MDDSDNSDRVHRFSQTFSTDDFDEIFRTEGRLMGTTSDNSDNDSSVHRFSQTSNTDDSDIDRTADRLMDTASGSSDNDSSVHRFSQTSNTGDSEIYRTMDWRMGATSDSSDNDSIAPNTNNSSFFLRQWLLEADVVEDQAFQFPVRQFMKMISPRYLKDSNHRTNNHSLDDFFYLIDFPFFDEAVDYGYSECCSHTRLQWHSWATLPTCMWPSRESGMFEYYEPITDLLNTLVEIGHSALDAVGVPLPREDRFYSHLTFLVYDRGVQDYPSWSNQGHQPRIAGGNDISEPDMLSGWWGAPRMKENDPRVPHANLEIIVLSDDSWVDMIDEGIKYAKCQFMAHPSRTFVLMLAIHVWKGTMRFLLFHRSGLTATEEINLMEHDGCKDLLRVMMTILLWSEQHDAGFPECSNDVEFFLADDSGVSTWTITDIVSNESHCVLGQAPCETMVEPRGSDADRQCGQTELQGRSKGRLCRQEQCGIEKAAANAEQSNTDRNASLMADNMDIDNRHPSLMRIPVCYSPHCESGVIHQFETRGRRKSIFLPGHRPRHCMPVNVSHLKSGMKFLIKESWQTLDRVNLEEDIFGTTRESAVQAVVGSMAVEYSNGEAQSTSIFLPTDDAASQMRWVISGKRRKGKYQKIKRRQRVLLLMIAMGKELIHCSSPWDLCESISHSLLGEREHD